MSDRRAFLKTSLVVAAGAAETGSRALAGSATMPVGIIYNRAQPGMWEQKVGGHEPRVSVEGGAVMIFTNHPMNAKHYIVRHSLVAEDGSVLGAETFYPNDEEARSSYPLPAGATGTYYASSFCNKHDFWVTRFTV